jgi:hypothetical protein
MYSDVHNQKEKKRCATLVNVRNEVYHVTKLLTEKKNVGVVNPRTM